MKIAFLATQFPDYSVEAATALARSADVLLVADKDQLDLDSSAEKRAALAQSGRLAEYRQKRFHRFIAIATIVTRIALFRPDIVIAHIDPRLHVTLIYSLIARFTRLVLVVHDPLPHQGRDWEFAARRYWQVRRQVAAAELFFVHGPYCARQWAADNNPFGRMNGRRVVTLAHGPILRPAEDAPVPGRRVLMFGRMEAYKGLDVLLAALRLLVARDVPVEIRLAGRGPDLDRLEPEFRAAGCCSIRADFVPREEAIAEFRAAAIVVVPYTEATQSGVVAAAFAHGRPVIASDVGGLPDFVRDGENGLLVPPRDPLALANAIQSLIEDTNLLRRLSAGAQASSGGEMSWETFAARSLDEIRAAFKAGGGTASIASLGA